MFEVIYNKDPATWDIVSWEELQPWLLENIGPLIPINEFPNQRGWNWKRSPRPPEFGRGTYFVLLFSNVEDMIMFKMRWL